MSEECSLHLSVIVPVFNEKATVLPLLEKVLAVPIDKEVVIVDDGSTDGTREILRAFQHPDVRIVFHEKNQGKGAAIRTAVREVRGDITLIQDADLEYSPDEYPRLLKPIEEGVADVVYGSRFLGGERRALLFTHAIGNKFLTFLSNAFTNLNLTDMETCYKVFRTEILKSITIKSNRFNFEPEITAKIAKRRARVVEIPISYWGRDYSEGKKIGWKDGVSALVTIVRFWMFD
jgi:glycosyltransferase involved in cell wall biosynthesis